MNTRSKILSFWKQKARQHKTTPDASWGDPLMIREVQELSRYLSDGDRVLDVGCANGSSSLQFIQNKHITLHGIDYALEMIQYAKKAQKLLPADLSKRATFAVGDACDLKVKPGSFDVVISTRCVCNLITWRDQLNAIKNMHKALKPGGILLLSEPTFQGLDELNKAGKLFGLKPLTSPWHNLYVDEALLLKDTKKIFQTRIDYFSSSYYFFSRILYRFLRHDDVSKLSRSSLFKA